MCTEEVMNTRNTVGSRLLQVSNWKRSLHGRRFTGKRSGRVFFCVNRESHQGCARFVNGRRVVLLRSALVPRTVGLTCVVLIVQLLTCSPVRVATTVTRDSRNTCRRWDAVGGCSCDRDRTGSLTDGWATGGRAKLGRTDVQPRDVACVYGSLALRCAEVWRMDSLRIFLELKYVQCRSCPRSHAGGNSSTVNTLLHTCWSLDEVLAWPSMLEVFTCLRSVGRRCYDGVKSWRERIHSRRACSMVSVG